MIQVFAQSERLGFQAGIPLAEVRDLLADPKTTLWIDLQAPSDPEVLEIQTIFNFHPLCIEDCLTYSNSPKLDEFEDYVFLVTHEPRMEEETLSVERPELDFFLGKNYLVSFHFHESLAIRSTINRCHMQSHGHEVSRTLPHVNIFRDSDFILQSILDSIVDDYFPLLDRLEDKITRIEDRVLASYVDRPTVEELIHLKRQLSAIRRFISPQRDVLTRLIHSSHPALSQHSRFYFQDVYDHVIRAYEIMDGHRDAMHNILEAYYSLLSTQTNESSNRMNFIMQRLTIITTIFMPLSFVAGIYGMNFKHMPELDWVHGYAFVLSVMTAVAIGMLIFFRRQKWL